MKKFWLWSSVGVGSIAVFLWMTGIIGWTDNGATRRALAGSGYTNVQIKGYPLFGIGCDHTDTVRTKFEATSSTGVKITGVVCKGWGFGKASTIRTF
jgi:hypothetical protein